MVSREEEVYDWLSADDCLVWTHVIRTVVPIGEKRQNSWDSSRGGGEFCSCLSSVPSRSSLSRQDTLQKGKGGKHWFDQHGPLVRRRAGHFRRSHLLIESTLDLHGLGQTRAHVALRRFVDKAWQSGLRSVLVITGKGTRTDGGVGVLRAAVPLWLKEPDLQSKILSFTYAQPRDGGEGALYLFIRRRRVHSSIA